MSLTVPEILIQNTVDNIIAFIKADWDTAVDKTTTILYDMWNGVSHGNYNYYEQAQKVFTKTDADNRKIKILPAYGKNQNKFPCITVNSSNQTTGGQDGLGFDINSADVYYDEANLQFADNYARSFTGTTSVVIYSDNKEEVLLIYYTVMSFLELLSDHLHHSGFKNLKISGRELQILPKDIQEGVFVKAIQLNGYIVQEVRDYLKTSMVQSFTFDGTPIESSVELS